jgi:hypothetical protein
MQIMFAAPFILVRKPFPLCALLVCVFLGLRVQAQQDDAKPLKPNDPRLNFSFAVSPGAKPLRFHVNLNMAGTITGVSVYRNGQSVPFQTLPDCSKFPDAVDALWLNTEIAQLIDHQDFNFDSFQDLELLQNYIPHLDKRLYCIFLWDNHPGQFRLSTELSDLDANLEAHPENRTLTGREDWQGGAWQDSTYRWEGGHPELFEQSGLLGDWGLRSSKEQPCGFEFSCSRRIHGKMAVTLHKWVCSPEEMDHLPACPVAASAVVPRTTKLPPDAR